MRFTKMQGLGNDYLYVYDEVPDNIKELSIKLSDRHFGAGSDGMIYISPSKIADFKMRIFNADGSEAMMCGNGVRCVGKYVYDKGYTDKKVITVETLSGIKTLTLFTENGKVSEVSVQMGKAEVGGNITVPLKNGDISCVRVSVGNPHAVVLVKSVKDVDVALLGAEIEKHPLFTGGVNVEFAEIISRNKIRMRVWERGSGITMACGTGASATVAAAASKGYCEYGKPVSVILDGGTLLITVSKDNDITMAGPAETVYEGEI